MSSVKVLLLVTPGLDLYNLDWIIMAVELMNSIQNTTKGQYYQRSSKSQIPNPNEKKKEKVYDIRDRTLQFGQRIIDIADMLPDGLATEVIRKQILRSGMSVGANVEEGDGTLTKRDFINKFVIARKEAKEVKYWLRMLSGKFIDEEEIQDDIKEAQEIVNVLSAIIINTKESKKSKTDRK